MAGAKPIRLGLKPLVSIRTRRRLGFVFLLVLVGLPLVVTLGISWYFGSGAWQRSMEKKLSEVFGCAASVREAALVGPCLVTLRAVELAPSAPQPLRSVNRMELELDAPFSNRFRQIWLDGAELVVPKELLSAGTSGFQTGVALFAGSLPPGGINLQRSVLRVTSSSGQELLKLAELAGKIAPTQTGIHLLIGGSRDGKPDSYRTVEAAVELHRGRLVRRITITGKRLALTRQLVADRVPALAAFFATELSGKVCFRDTPTRPVVEVEGGLRLDLEKVAGYLRIGSFDGLLDVHIRRLVLASDDILAFEGDFLQPRTPGRQAVVSFEALRNLHYLVTGEFPELPAVGETAYRQAGFRLSWDGQVLSVTGLLEPGGGLLVRGKDGEELLSVTPADVSVDELLQRYLKLQTAHIIL